MKLAMSSLTKEQIISLARVGKPAIDEIPRLVKVCSETNDPVLRAICLNAMMKILFDSSHQFAKEAARELTIMFEHPRCRRVRRRIAMTLAYIGRSAACSLPALVRQKRRGARESLHGPVRTAIFYIARDCLDHGTDSERLEAISALASAGGYGPTWLLRDFLVSGAGAPSTQAAANAAFEQLIKRNPLEPRGHSGANST